MRPLDGVRILVMDRSLRRGRSACRLLEIWGATAVADLALRLYAGSRRQETGRTSARLRLDHPPPGFRSLAGRFHRLGDGWAWLALIVIAPARADGRTAHALAETLVAVVAVNAAQVALKRAFRRRRPGCLTEGTFVTALSYARHAEATPSGQHRASARS